MLGVTATCGDIAVNGSLICKPHIVGKCIVYQEQEADMSGTLGRGRTICA
jgi:hypothetical protein